MATILLLAFLMFLNIVLALQMHNKGNYQIAIFNGFAAGVCFMGFLYSIITIT